MLLHIVLACLLELGLFGVSWAFLYELIVFPQAVERYTEAIHYFQALYVDEATFNKF